MLGRCYTVALLSQIIVAAIHTNDAALADDSAEITLADAVPLTEDGYQVIASLRSTPDMSVFAMRLLHAFGREVDDFGKLDGITRFHSGEETVQSFDRLQEELLANFAATQDPTAVQADAGSEEASAPRADADLQATEELLATFAEEPDAGSEEEWAQRGDAGLEAPEQGEEEFTQHAGDILEAVEAQVDAQAPGQGEDEFTRRAAGNILEAVEAQVNAQEAARRYSKDAKAEMDRLRQFEDATNGWAVASLRSLWTSATEVDERSKEDGAARVSNAVRQRLGENQHVEASTDSDAQVSSTKVAHAGQARHSKASTGSDAQAGPKAAHAVRARQSKASTDSDAQVGIKAAHAEQMRQSKASTASSVQSSSVAHVEQARQTKVSTASSVAHAEQARQTRASTASSVQSSSVAHAEQARLTKASTASSSVAHAEQAGQTRASTASSVQSSSVAHAVHARQASTASSVQGGSLAHAEQTGQTRASTASSVQSSSVAHAVHARQTTASTASSVQSSSVAQSEHTRQTTASTVSSVQNSSVAHAEQARRMRASAGQRVHVNSSVARADQAHQAEASETLQSATTLTDGPHVQIMGLFDTGTNYLKSLLEKNFAGQVSVYDMYTPHAHYWRYAEQDSCFDKPQALRSRLVGHLCSFWKHANLDVIKARSPKRLQQMHELGVVGVAMVRDPMSWFQSIRAAPYDFAQPPNSVAGNDWLVRSYITTPSYYGAGDTVRFSSLSDVWNNHTRSYEDLAAYGFDNFLVIRYEDLVMNTQSVLRNMADVLNITPPFELIQVSKAAKSGVSLSRSEAVRKITSKSYLDKYTMEEKVMACNRLDIALMLRHGYTTCDRTTWAPEASTASSVAEQASPAKTGKVSANVSTTPERKTAAPAAHKNNTFQMPSRFLSLKQT